GVPPVAGSWGPVAPPRARLVSAAGLLSFAVVTLSGRTSTRYASLAVARTRQPPGTAVATAPLTLSPVTTGAPSPRSGTHSSSSAAGPVAPAAEPCNVIAPLSGSEVSASS